MDNFVEIICRPGKGADTCRYLMMGGGWRCGKLDREFRSIIDKRFAEKTLNAQGDNCPGKPYTEILGS